MLSILFFILKLIGIILASILGILIVLLLIILFIPIRYRIDGQKYETISLEAKIGWLLRILYCHIIYVDNKLSIQFRIFSKLYYDNNIDNHRNKKVKKRKKKNKIRKPKAKNEEYRHIDSEVRMDLGTSDGRIKSDSRIESDDRMDSDSRTESDDRMESGSRMESDDRKTNKKVNKKTKRFFRKLNQIFAKIKHFFIRLKEKIVSIINFIKNIKSKITTLWGKWEKIKAFFHNETNKAGIKKIWISIKKLMKHIYPTKLKMEVEYGTGDPCDTGQALAVMAVLYGYYGKSIKIIPNFEAEILEGTLHCKGRIRIFTLLIISIKLILDKNFRRLIQNFNSIKEEL